MYSGKIAVPPGGGGIVFPIIFGIKRNKYVFTNFFLVNPLNGVGSSFIPPSSQFFLIIQAI
jgi:hypothetical protein